MEGWCMSNKNLALCQDVVIMSVFHQLLTSFCHIWKTYGQILLIFGTVMRYPRALVNIKNKLAPCQIMVIMTHLHHIRQYLPRSLAWFCSYFIQWLGTMEGWCMSNKILALCQDVVIMAVFHQRLTSFCHIWKTYGSILLIFGTVMRYHNMIRLC